MSRFQAGALVVYGNLGVHEVEGVGLRRFCDESAREYYTLRPYFSDSHDRSYIPTEKEAALRPVTPAQQAEADLARIKAEKLPIPAEVLHNKPFFFVDSYKVAPNKKSLCICW